MNDKVLACSAVDYRSRSYLSKKRWISYWYQINEAHLTGDDTSILEIGPGNNIVKQVLIGMGHAVKTVDFDQKTNPDYLADVRQLRTVVNDQFDVVLCCQILEHISYKHFENVLGDLTHISRKHLIVTLPYTTKGTFASFIAIKFLPFLKPFLWVHIFPLFPQVHTATHVNGHQWEIGKKDYSLKKVLKSFKKAGWIVKKHEPIFENPYHYLFVCEKTPMAR